MGTLWLSVTMLAVVILKAVLFSEVLSVPTERLVPSLAMGMAFWALISYLVTGGANAFISQRTILSDGKYSLLVPVLSNITSGFFVFAHGFFAMLLVSCFYITPTFMGALIMLSGLALIAWASVGVGFTLAYICTRYRDLERFTKSLMSVMFIVTPVIWLPELVSSKKGLLTYNPFYHVLEVVRDPIIGQPIELINWYVTFGLGMFFWGTAIIIKRIWSRRIMLWV